MDLLKERPDGLDYPLNTTHALLAAQKCVSQRSLGTAQCHSKVNLQDK